MHRASMVHPARFTRASLQASRVPHSQTGRCVVHTPPTRARACETCEAKRCQSQYDAEWTFGYVLNRRRRSIAKERDARGWTVMVSCTIDGQRSREWYAGEVDSRERLWATSDTNKLLLCESGWTVARTVGHDRSREGRSWVDSRDGLRAICDPRTRMYSREGLWAAISRMVRW